MPSGSAPDIAGALHLADLIRSSSVAPVKATAAFLRRLNHDNPNVQLLTLQVLDIAIKNGGTPFLLVIGGRELTNDLERLARARDGSSNRQVQELVLKLIQDWASAFSAKAGLRDTELVRAYESMRRDNLSFPPRDPLATAAMVDSLSVRFTFPLFIPSSFFSLPLQAAWIRIITLRRLNYRHPNGPIPLIVQGADQASP